MSMEEMMGDVGPEAELPQTDDISEAPDDGLPESDPYEAEAMKYGWKPADDWAGDGHMSAEKFMTRGPGTSRKLEAQVSDLTKRLDEVTQSSDERIRRTEQAVKAAADARVKAAEDSIRAQMREAVESGDTARFDELEKQRDEIRQEQQPSGPSEADQNAVKAWVADNPKYQSDPIFQGAAQGAWKQAEAAGITSVPDILKFVDGKLGEMYGSKTPEPTPTPKRAAPAVEAGGVAPRRQRGKGWSDIPAEDRKLAEEFISDGTFDELAKSQKTTPQEAYAASYWSQDQ